ncbi:MAG: Nif3-like dinuclear metal center hexameric protein [Ignavibacteria bacterium RBG_13_36_8]|nr:MAG: Nif3-like dinuclear metal center hexameric protein [Ignavibacteria bacterium RBG_13_36_8]
MTCNELIKYLEDWAPPDVSMERDNVGLQVGSGRDKIRNIFLCLELNEKALNEATKKNCNFIFTHHPLIYKPLHKIDTQNNPTAKLIEKIIKSRIIVYSAHTNLDFSKGGVSFELANALGLKNLEFLQYRACNQFKLVAFVPEKHLEKVSVAVFEAGGGLIGEYKKCSYRLKGEGTFEGSEKTNPAIGTKQTFETVREIRLEVLVDSWNLNKVIANILKVHPYEEPAFDIYPLMNKNSNYGEGVIGEFDKIKSVVQFLHHISRTLNTSTLRYCKGKVNKIKKVAVCGGSGAELISSAIKTKADAFVTADIKYHAFQDAEGQILIIDAGHYETEILSLNGVKRKIENFLTANGETIKVFKYSGSTNPIRFYNYKE